MPPPNPSLHPTRYSGLRPLPRAGELKRYDNGTDRFERIFFGALPCLLQPIKRLGVVVENFLHGRL